MELFRTLEVASNRNSLHYSDYNLSCYTREPEYQSLNKTKTSFSHMSWYKHPWADVAAPWCYIPRLFRSTIPLNAAPIFLMWGSLWPHQYSCKQEERKVKGQGTIFSFYSGIASRSYKLSAYIHWPEYGHVITWAEIWSLIWAAIWTTQNQRS